MSFFDQTVGVFFRRANQIDNVDLLDQADLFPTVRINGSLQTAPAVFGQDTVVNPPWNLGEEVDGRFVSLTISLFDDDRQENIFGGTEHMDINPAAGARDLNLTYDMQTGRVTNADTNEVLASTFLEPISIAGDGDSRRAAITFAIGGIATDNEGSVILGDPSVPSVPSAFSGGFGASRLAGFSGPPGITIFPTTAVVAGKLDRDSFDDLVVANFTTGKIDVFRGSDSGLLTSRVQAQSISTVGSSLAIGDFNGDGSNDLIVGKTSEVVGGQSFAGEIQVISGSDSGLRSGLGQSINQATSGILSGPTANERFGAALAVADFNNDTFDDVAIGVPGNSEGSIKPGAVQVIYGSSQGLTELRKADQLFGENSRAAGRKVPGQAESNDRYGESLVAGDFNGDGQMDLAVGIPGNRDNVANAGGVHIIWGDPNRRGLTLTPDGQNLKVEILSQGLSQDSNGNRIDNRSGDAFGYALASGDFNGDGLTDLAVGAPGKGNNAGAVFIYRGQSNSFDLSSRPQIILQSDLGLTNESGDRFGSTLAARDINGDRRLDLIIGAPGEDNGQGEAYVLLGSNNGLDAINARLLQQGAPGVVGTPEGIGTDFSNLSNLGNDFFGAGLVFGNFNGDLERPQLAIAVPNEAVNGVAPGAVNIVSNTNLFGANSSTLTRQSLSRLNGNQGNNRLNGTNADGILNGGRGNDKLFARGGGDIVLGGAGNDLVNAGAGDDLLDAGPGARDRYVGGEGRDTFVLSANNGRAIILDFEDKIDRIGLANGLSFKKLNLKRSGQDTLIRRKQTVLGIVRNTNPGELTAKDFTPIEYNPLQGLMVPTPVLL